MIHFALEVAAFLFLAWVALMVFAAICDLISVILE